MFASVAGAFIWLYIHDRKIQEPQINVTVNLPEQSIIQTPSNTSAHSKKFNTEDKKDKPKTTEIPIDEPDRSDDWLNITPTDSN